MKLGKVQKVDLREVWKHEASDFTNWLAQADNLEQLSQEIGIDIRLIKTEANVGRFNVDILAEEEATGHKIIIENQLEDTNHDHLGKIITYASGYDARVIIWVVRNAREEHQKAIEWLNENTVDEIGFFLIAVQLWKIGDSEPAPKFEVLSKPNEWSKTLKLQSINPELTDTKLAQLEYWEKFKQYASVKDMSLKLRNPRPQHWYDISIGSSEAHVTLTINSRENLIGCEIYIQNNKELSNFLKSKENEFTSLINRPIKWIEASKASRIKLELKSKEIFKDENHKEQFDWLYQNTIILRDIFSRLIKEFKNNNF